MMLGRRMLRLSKNFRLFLKKNFRLFLKQFQQMSRALRQLLNPMKRRMREIS